MFMALIGGRRTAAGQGEVYECAFFEECGRSVEITNHHWNTGEYPDGWVRTKSKKFHCPQCSRWLSNSSPATEAVDDGALGAVELSEVGRPWDALKRYGFTMCAMCARIPCCGLLVGSKKRGPKKPRCPECHLGSGADDLYGNTEYWFELLEKHAESILRQLWQQQIDDPIFETRTKMLAGPKPREDYESWSNKVGGGIDGGADAAMVLAWDAARMLNRQMDRER